MVRKWWRRDRADSNEGNDEGNGFDKNSNVHSAKFGSNNEHSQSDGSEDFPADDVPHNDVMEYDKLPQENADGGNAVLQDVVADFHHPLEGPDQP